MLPSSCLRIDLAQGQAFTDPLGVPAEAAFHDAPYEPHILHAPGQSVGDHRIPIRTRPHRKPERPPRECPVAPSQTGGVGLPFETPNLMKAPFPLEPDFSGAPQGDVVRRVKGPTGQGLPDHRIDLSADP